MSIVTERFVETLKIMKQEGHISSYRQFALSVDYLPQSLSEIINGRRDVSLEILRKAIAQYNVNPAYLFNGEGPRFVTVENRAEGRFQTIVIDQNEQEQVMFVPKHDQSIYARQSDQSTILAKFSFIRLPELMNQKNSYRAFEVSGDAMEPILFEGDKVVCSWIESTLWHTVIRDHYVYVVVTHDNVYINRVINRMKEEGHIVLCSDNIYYNDIIISQGDIREIWFIRTKISPFLASPKNVKLALHDELDTIQTMIKEQTQTIRILSETFQQLPNQPQNDDDEPS